MLVSGLRNDYLRSYISNVVGVGSQAVVAAVDETLVIRLGLADTEDRVRYALAAARMAGASGIPVASSMSHIQLGEVHGIIMERLANFSLLDLLCVAPWRIVAISRLMGSLHAKIHQISATEEMPTIPYRPKLQSMPRRHSDRSRLLHGDFNPANILWKPGSGWTVIDWTDSWVGPPEADIANTLNMIEHGRPGPLSNHLPKIAIGVARSTMRSNYLLSYSRTRSIDKTELKDWSLAFDGNQNEGQSDRCLTTFVK